MTPIEAGTPDVFGGKILVVDDHPNNVILLEHMLENAGYRDVTSTTDPCKVSGLHRQHAYDLILLDMQMPCMDGFQVMDELKQIDPTYLPVLALTANTDYKLRALQAGARDFVGKPFDLAEVLMRVQNLVEMRLLNRQLLDQGRQLERLALLDPLTGLANRRLLEDRVAVALAQARRQQGGMALMYLDLDGFKGINDSLGHAVGDALLKASSQRVRSMVRQEDTVCRFGGDEFVIALPHVNLDSASKIALKIIEALATPFAIEGETIALTVSVGVSSFPDHGSDVASLLQAADAALYDAKRAGKNTFRTPARPH